ncbi:phage shock protein PspA [Thalassotalea mangrovi]|uniref:Phage shock protein PspA n=1 Tax=Thalassotalea mangrovi TaxID=2572245 RepID=A0A4U1B4N8_9GAMM|nr:phage shock protein PspA [Thalassotalea mangrovi]TKB45304.1 phage shock protein PspA [Thalassotalea mangrovi]
MGMFSRLTDIINANINSLLDKAEDPEKMIRLIIQEMEETLVEVRTSAAKQIAEKKTLTRQLRVQTEKANQWQEKAELAISKGRDDLARQALLAKQQCQPVITDIETQLAQVEELLESIQNDSNRLQEKLQEAKQRQEACLKRQQSAQVRLKVRETVKFEQIDDAILRFEKFQQKVDGLEAQVEAYDMTEAKNLQAQFDELEAEDSIEQELQAMKKKVANG